MADLILSELVASAGPLAVVALGAFFWLKQQFAAVNARLDRGDKRFDKVDADADSQSKLVASHHTRIAVIEARGAAPTHVADASSGPH